MLITSAEVLVASPGRNFVTLRITTDDGYTGLGDATLNGRELAVAAYLSEHVVPLLIGREAGRIEDTWQYLYRGAYWRRGPVTMAAIAAVDTALWDIKAKAAGMPLYQLLGGRSRDGLLVYGHASGLELPELFDSIREHLEEGYRAIRIQTGIPGLPSVYGRGRHRGGYGCPLRLRAGAAQRASGRGDLGHACLPAAHPRRLRGGAQRVRAGAAPSARRAPQAHAHPGREAWQVARAVRPVLARGRHAGREPVRAEARA
jgi:hypothetical protein